MKDGQHHSNCDSHVNRIPGVSLEDAGFVHTRFGSYHPVTEEGLSIDAPREITQQILVALISDSEVVGPEEPFDWDHLLLGGYEFSPPS